MPSVVETFVTSALKQATESGAQPQAVIQQRLASLNEMVGGYDFAQVIASYCRGHETGNEALQSDAIRWLRGEFSTRTDARQALGVRTIIDDASVYDHLKLLARFVRLSGYKGLFVCLDELVNVYKLANSQARKSNFEQILRILNDTLGGGDGIGFVLGGTPDFLMDTRKGLYSYEALQSRLAENPFAREGIVDYSGPVLRLMNLSPEDLFVLLQNIRNVHASDDENRVEIPDEAIEAFMSHCSQKVGDAHFRTPRSSVKAFVNLLAVLDQNPGLQWSNLVDSVELESDTNPDLEPLDESAEPGDELTSFQI